MSICTYCGELKLLGHKCDPSKIALRNTISNSMGNESGPTHTGNFGGRCPHCGDSILSLNHRCDSSKVGVQRAIEKFIKK